MSEWQPIETKPETGGEVLVYQPSHKSGRNNLPARICLSSQAGFVRGRQYILAPLCSTHRKQTFSSRCARALLI